MTEDLEEENPAADAWFQKTFDEFEELSIKRINEAIEDEGVPVHLAALAGMAVFIGLLTKLAHHSGLDHDRVEQLVRQAHETLVKARAN